jgi:hypothetical protein
MSIAVKTTVALAASLAVNVALLGGLDLSARHAQVAPQGVVEVTQLPDEIVLAASTQPAQSVGGSF